MLLLGIDLGTSSVKVCVVDSASGTIKASAQYPELEMEISSVSPGFAEQTPLVWWETVKSAILRCHDFGKYNPKDIGAIGITYQMHGLVLLDESGKVLRDSIIWCDSRAVEFGNSAEQAMGKDYVATHLLNSPGNFTASKVGWVRENEPEVFAKVSRMMLPGDYIAFRMTGENSCSAASLSEGICWDFKLDLPAHKVLEHFDIRREWLGGLSQVFGSHGQLHDVVADELGLGSDVTVSYKAGDQPNNALALGVMRPGEVAATSGTSGVIYAVTDKLIYDEVSRVNTFAHVNHSASDPRLGVLLCINGAGSVNRWAGQLANGMDYVQMNNLASAVPAGSSGLLMLPFGNGAERMLGNKVIGARMEGLDFNRHQRGHFYRAVQEGVAFAFSYGLDILRENGLEPKVIRASNANMFMSGVFRLSFANACGVAVELYDGDGSVGAAIGAGIGMGIFREDEQLHGLRVPAGRIEPKVNELADHFQHWKEILNKSLKEKLGQVPTLRGA